MTLLRRWSGGSRSLSFALPFGLAERAGRRGRNAGNLLQDLSPGQLEEIKDEKAFLAWAAWRIAVSRASPISGQPLSQETADESSNIVANLVTEASETQLHRLVDALPLELRLPLALSTVDGMTSPEIAKVMGIPEGTVRTRLQRARAILKRKISLLSLSAVSWSVVEPHESKIIEAAHDATP